MIKKLQVIFFLLLVSFSARSQKILLTADRLFDGELLHKNYAVLVEGNKILAVDAFSSLKAKADTIIQFGDKTIMPGMIEGHSHVLLYPYDQRSWNDQVLKESRSLRAIRGAIMAERQLMAGFTTVRDLGSEGAEYADVAVKRSIETGLTPGPRMIVAGRAIVASGSYGPKGFHPDVHTPLGAQAADGDELRKVTREQIGYGADVVKVYADYRTGPRGESMPTFSLEELKLVVEAAKSSGRKVVAHAATEEGMRRAILAGVSTIEHGSEATGEIYELMKQHKVALCPTLAATYSINTYGDWDGKSLPEPQEITEKRESFKNALKHNVTIIAGGDVGVFPHGKNALELVLMAEYGMSNIDVLKAATSSNAKWISLDPVGNLKKDYLADIIVVDGDPSEEISKLYDVDFVMKDGDIYKS